MVIWIWFNLIQQTYRSGDRRETASRWKGAKAPRSGCSQRKQVHQEKLENIHHHLNLSGLDKAERRTRNGSDQSGLAQSHSQGRLNGWQCNGMWLRKGYDGYSELFSGIYFRRARELPHIFLNFSLLGTSNRVVVGMKISSLTRGFP